MAILMHLKQLCTYVHAELCPRPDSILNGKVEFSSIMEGGVATYSCNSGYGLVGAYSQLTCHHSGSWSDSPPRCYSELNTVGNTVVVLFTNNGYIVELIACMHKAMILLPHACMQRAQ